jgi:hypothetical protein
MNRTIFSLGSYSAAALLCILSTTFAQRMRAEDPLAATSLRLSSDLMFLSSDDQEGRDTGSEGIARAGAFIVDRFNALGLDTKVFDGQAYQEFSIPGPAKLGDAASNVLLFSGDALPEMPAPELGVNYTSLSLGSNGDFSGELVFAGYGITATELDYDDYASLDVKGKVVIVIRKEPQQNIEDSKFDGTRSSQYAYFSSKENNAALHEVAAMILVNDASTAKASGDQLLGATGGGAAITSLQVPTVFAKRELVDALVRKGTGKSLEELEAEIDSDGKPRSAPLLGLNAEGKTFIEASQIPARNVIALLPGSGALADEYVVVGAHYDHVGMGGAGSLAPGTVAIHNGADDNGSGTTTMLEIARRMAEDQSENRRNIVFMAFTAEEKGLLGSKHYVRNPRFPLEKTVAMVNLDMVGRLTDNALTVYGTGTADSFDAMIDRLNEKSQFALDKQPAGFGPSDHSSFYEVEIPVFHFFTGLHNDYHRPSDDFETVNIEGMARIADMVTSVVSEISTASKRPSLIKNSAVAQVGRTNRRGPARVVIGVMMDQESEAAKIKEVNADGPAAKAGMLAEDVIIQIGDQDVASFAEMRAAMRGMRAGDVVKITVQRGEDTVELNVTLADG